MRFGQFPSLAVAAALLSGCAGRPWSAGPLDQPAPGPERAPPSGRTPDPAPAPQPTGDITLRDALAATLTHSPALAAYSLEARAREARAIQAGLLPNPELEAELEGFGGTGSMAGLGAAEATLALGQLVELGGKRIARRRAARYEAQLAGWDYEIARLDALARAATDYIELLGAERRREGALETAQLAERMFEAVSARVEAGRAPPLDRTRAAVELSLALLEAGQAERSVDAARIRLASNWGSYAPVFERALGDLGAGSGDAPPELADLLARLDENPDVARWATEAAAHQAEVELALAQRIPDLTARAGVRYQGEDDEIGLVAGLSIPLPIYDRGQGATRAARLGALGSGRLAAAARSQAGAAIAEAHITLRNAHAAVLAFEQDVAPGALVAVEAAQEAFAQGKIGAMDLLDTQRTLFDTRMRLLDAYIAWRRAAINLERLLGDSLLTPTGDPQ